MHFISRTFQYADFADHAGELDCSTDNRPVDELLQFINGNAGGKTSEVKPSTKAAKRQRQKMKKVC